MLRATLSTGGQVVADRSKTCFVGALFISQGGQPDAGPPDRSGTRRRRFKRGRLIVAVALLLTAGVMAQATDSLPVELPLPWPVQEGTAGTVRSGTEWNVRVGSSAGSHIVGLLQSGEPVRVRCLDGNWVKLISPYGDAFVHIDGLVLDSEPPAC